MIRSYLQRPCPETYSHVRVELFMLFSLSYLLMLFKSNKRVSTVDSSSLLSSTDILKPKQSNIMVIKTS